KCEASISRAWPTRHRMMKPGYILSRDSNNFLGAERRQHMAVQVDPVHAHAARLLLYDCVLGEIARGKFGESDGAFIVPLCLRWVGAIRHKPEQPGGFPPCLLWRPRGAVLADGEAARWFAAASHPVLENIDPFPGRCDLEPEPLKLGIPEKSAGRRAVDRPFGQLDPHVRCPASNHIAITPHRA